VPVNGALLFFPLVLTGVRTKSQSEISMKGQKKKKEYLNFDQICMLVSVQMPKLFEYQFGFMSVFQWLGILF
jgi:hypothetical protein